LRWKGCLQSAQEIRTSLGMSDPILHKKQVLESNGKLLRMGGRKPALGEFSQSKGLAALAPTARALVVVSMADTPAPLLAN